MDEFRIRDDGEEEESRDKDRPKLESKSAREIGTGAGTMPEQYRKSDNYEELIKAEMKTLLAIAAKCIRITCANPSDHKWEVAQEGIKNFLQSVGKRENDYDTPAKVLRAAVWQVGVRHSQTCPREQAVDFNETQRQRNEPGDNGSGNRHSRELTRKTSYNPIEVLNALLELKERLLGVNDIDLFVRYFEEGRTLQEIAKERGCSAMTVQRALKRLKKELGLPDDQGPLTPDPEE
jgi:hypothetical protein